MDKRPKEWRKKLTNRRDYKVVFKKIKAFFKGNEAKATSWMLQENPWLGGMSPVDMIIIGRGDKLLKWIVSAVDENERPK